MSDWRRITLGDLAKVNGCTIQTGPFGSQLHKHEYQAEGIGVVNPTHMADRRISHASIPCVSAEVAARLSKHQVRPGDLLFARRGEIGRHAIITESERGWLCGTGCFLVRVDSPESVPTYVSFYLSTDESVEWLNRHAAGVVMPNLSNTVLQRVPVALPPLPEQKKIAHILSTVQRAIEAQERIIQTTTELKMALMHKLFTEGLRNEPQKQTEIGLLPESWEVVELGSLAKVGNGSTPKRANEAYWEGGTIPWLNSTKIHDRFITEADQFVTPQAVKECHLPRVAPNSLLIAITGQGKTLGNSAITRIETCINQHLAYAQFHSAKIVPDFALWFMQTRYDCLRAIAHGGGSTKGALTCGFLKTLPIPVPSRPEQEEIATTFQRLEDKQDFTVRKQAALQDLFRTLLHELMTAKTRVHDLQLTPAKGSRG
ncbi:MAG: restriction endonuclease subunit S [Candidatus Accumulibacter sp.]|uniref:restriction endonuclease subunit S n=1 Tax=Accumulibacter sp. TaxID=2053492 RepID=UPI002588650B|nr:restriction endonuclease subunit S [Accumulibacter sp.]MCM8623306.1 restriction endonuclease subunit S [Accumulibacter sp.]